MFQSYSCNLSETYLSITKDYYAFGRLVHLRYAGIVGSVGYPLFYLIYLGILHQPYENLTVRLVATVGCSIPLAAIRTVERCRG